jgi:gliding motility-associated protein GldM
MAGLNETPRQKMIGILYLVLLGLAATTITDKVLEAFYTIKLSLDSTSVALQKATDDRMASFQSSKLKDDPVRATPYWDRANKVKAVCDELNKSIDGIRDLFVSQGGGYNPNSTEVVNRADVDLSPHLMTGIGPNARAAALKKQILDTREKLMAILTPDEIRTGVTISLDAPDPGKREGIKHTWEDDCFGDGTPLTAAMTALSKIQMDVKNTENSVVRKILSGVDKTDITLDEYEVIAVPESKYVLVGQQYKAEVFLTGKSSTLNPEITAGGQNLKVESGKGIYTATATAPGLKKYSASVKVKKTDGTYMTVTTKEDLEYMVAPPSVTISPTKMLVFYIGVPNPVSVSAAGVPKESIRPSINGAGGEMTGSGGEYVVTVKTPGKTVISVAGELEKGKSTVLGSTEFRCKKLPLPHPQFAGKGGGSLPTVQLKSANKLFAPMPADFDFDAKYTINSYKLYISKPRADVQTFKAMGGAFTPEMQSAMSSITAGTRIYFDEIVVTGPDGTKASCDPITFTAL